MYNLIIHKKAIEKLDFLKKNNKKILLNIIDNLDELKERGLNSSNIKNVGESIFRKRVSRYRILFTFDKLNKNKIHIWIIEIEKHTKKDYNIWKTYIINSLKFYKG